MFKNVAHKTETADWYFLYKIRAFLIKMSAVKQCRRCIKIKRLIQTLNDYKRCLVICNKRSLRVDGKAKGLKMGSHGSVPFAQGSREGLLIHLLHKGPYIWTDTSFGHLKSCSVMEWTIALEPKAWRKSLRWCRIIF